ncbi:MAG TPA: hypothetical protein VFX66_04130, partial [Sulfuricurvum sp.]|nr:hypothetical protein [Sulfuricurvum sp.]
MVVQSKENQTTSSFAELLGGSSQSKNSKSSKSNDVFAQLLSTLNDTKKGAKSLGKQDGFAAVIDPKKDNASSKLKSADIQPLDVKKLTAKGLSELLVGTEDERKALPKDLINALSNDQVHSLIQRAKDYLKNAITEKSPDLKADTKALPKTLRGLVELAHKIGIDLSEITLSTMDKESVSPLKDLPAPLLAKPLFEFKGSAKETFPEHSKGFEAIAQLLQEAKPTELKATEAKASTSEGKELKIPFHPLQSLLK